MQSYIPGLTYNNIIHRNPMFEEQPTILYSVYATVEYYKAIVYFSLNEYVEQYGFNFVVRLRFFSEEILYGEYSVQSKVIQ